MDTTPPTRKPRGFKIALIVLAAVAVLFVAGLFLLPYFLPVGTIKNIAKTQARDLAGMDVDFKSLGFGWTGGVVVGDITLAPLKEDGTPGDTLLTIDQAQANVSILPLLSGKIIVNSVTAEGFSLKVVREADGSLNLPDFSKIAGKDQAGLPSRATRNAIPLMALSPEGEAPAAPAAPAGALPPIEVHRVELKKGILAFDDKGSDLALDVGLDFLRVEGGDLNDPFLLQGLLLPYPGAPEKGEIPFTGRVALLKDGAFNPDGEANLEIDVKAFSLHELADKLGLGDLLASGQVDGVAKVAYSGGKGAVSIGDMRLAKTSLGLGEDARVAVPDTTFGLTARLDPAAGTLELADLSVQNDITEIRGRGWVEGINDLADGGAPVANIEYAGVADFARANAYVRDQGMGLEGLPTLHGQGSFSGKALLAKRETASEPLIPTLTLDFTDGSLGAVEETTGIGINLGLVGVGVRAAASLGETTAVNAGVNLANAPLRAQVPQLGETPVDVTLNGGAALSATDETTAVELRLKNTLAKVPASPWATAMAVACPETRVTYDLTRDVANIQAMSFTINDNIQGAVSGGSFSGILAGAPQGQADLEFRALLEQVREVFQPLMPETVANLTGSARSVTRVKLEGGNAEALTQAELDQTGVLVNLEPGVSQARAESPKVTLAVIASLALANPLGITVNSVDVNATGASLAYADKSGASMEARFGGAVVKAAGQVDAAGLGLSLSALALDVSGMNAVIGHGGVQTAGLSGGLLQVRGATAEQPSLAPLSGKGDFSIPSLEIGIDNLVFHRQQNEQREDSSFGNIRAQLAVDGYLGDAKPQIVNLRAAKLSSTTLAATSRAQADLGSGVFQAEYAARLAPTGMSALFGFMGLPPTLLADAAATGSLSWNGSQFDSKGRVEGKLSLASGEVNPFEMNHDLSAAVDSAAGSLAVSIRRLDGNIKTASGEAAATLAAQQSNLFLSRSGSKGLLDIRVNGSAAPTRQLLAGLIRIFPQLREYSDTLYQTQAEGVYQGWVQVREQGPDTLGVAVGGIWQGAAVTLFNAPFLAEAGQLAASLEGEYAHRENRVRVSKVFLRSESGQMQADGTAEAVFATGPDNAVTGLSNVNVDLRFVAADLQRTARVFPGVVPPAMALAGRVDGSFKAGGNADDIRISEGGMRFQNFQAQLSPGLPFTIPSGSATFNGVFSLHSGAGAPAGPASDFEVFRLFNVTGGQAALTGAMLQDKPIEAMSGAFDLQNGVLGLQSAQVRLGGGADTGVQAAGTVDFNAAAPVVKLQVAARNIPMAEVNSEIQQFMVIESGVVSMPAAQGQTAGVFFTGISKDEILQTLRLENVTFATGPVVLHTGPALNAELDKARSLLRMEKSSEGETRVITIKSIAGTVQAAGDGIISIPHENPINVIGDNTGDFRAWGEVYADHTLHIKVAVVGKLENILGFSLPNLIPNLRSGSDEDKNRFMAKMNENAAKEHYALRITGPLEEPDISGIGAVAGAFARDIFTAAPGQILGGVVDLGKDAPGTLVDAAGAILSAPGQAVKSPGSVPGAVINAPGNTLKGIGRAFGIGGRSREGGDESEEERAAPDSGQPQQTPYGDQPGVAPRGGYQ